MVVAADIRTMDPDHPRATALAIAGGRIAYVGDLEGLSAGWTAAAAISVPTGTVTPGLVDAHAHLYGLGLNAEAVALRGVASEAEAVRVVVEAARTRPAGEWLVGRGWDQNLWAGQAYPTRAPLDAAFPDRPVLLRRIDGHAAWVNGRALAAAGITRATKDPAGGQILRDARGEPTGVLIDNAADLVIDKVPAPTAAVRERRILVAAQQAVATGLTGVHDMGIDDATAAVYERLAAEGRLPLRVYAMLQGDATKPARLDTPPRPAVGRFQMRGVKLYADGSLGSRGARLYAPYTDESAHQGLWVTDPATLILLTERAVAHGWQVAVHAIGDAGVGAVLDAFTVAQAAHPGEHRLRVEHAQVIAPADLERMVPLRVIASMQPTHATSDMPWAEQRLGPERIHDAYAWRAVLDRGIPLAAGSDFPIEEVAPLLGLFAAVTRTDHAGQPAGGWYPAQRLTLDEAIGAFTTGAAYAEGAEATRGTIAVGRAADLTVFDRRLDDPAGLASAQVAYTIVDGGVVYKGALPPRTFQFNGAELGPPAGAPTRALTGALTGAP